MFYIVMEPTEKDNYRIVSPEKGFDTIKEAVTWAEDNDYYDSVIMRFERFV